MGVSHEQKIQALRRRRDEFFDYASRALEEMDQEIEKVEARAKQVLTKRGRRQFFDPHVQAGKANVEKVRSVLAGRMAATQAEITRESKVSSGSVTWALRALEKDRAIRPTGRKVGKSREYELVRNNKVTRRAPGS